MFIIVIGRGKRRPQQPWWRTNPDWAEHPTKNSTGNIVFYYIFFSRLVLVYNNALLCRYGCYITICVSVCLYMFVCQSSWWILFIPPANEVWGNIFFTLSVCLSVRPSVRSSIHPSVHLSVCLSFRLSVCLFVCLSPVCGHDSKRWVHNFYENLYTDY